ncbi:hypothetical protein WMF18_10970 [Sorangium sp. So ce315]|uniref:hypothetical protein n=1 Tax=Sorangium sp. So ce315 TaxID=3133299 RepID=UPI003F6155B7
MPLSKLGLECRCMSADIHPDVSTSRTSVASSWNARPGASVTSRSTWMPYSMPRDTVIWYRPGSISTSPSPVAVTSMARIPFPSRPSPRYTRRRPSPGSRRPAAPSEANAILAGIRCPFPSATR